MKYSTKIEYKIIDPNRKPHTDPLAQELIEKIQNRMLKAFTEVIRAEVEKYKGILKCCHIEFILDLSKSESGGFSPTIHKIYVPENKKKMVDLVLNLIKNRQEEKLIIKRQKKFN